MVAIADEVDLPIRTRSTGGIDSPRGIAPAASPAIKYFQRPLTYLSPSALNLR